MGNKIRRLNIGVAVTADFKNFYKQNWREVIQKTVEESSKIFEQEFKIRLVIKKIKIKRSGKYEAMPYNIFSYTNGLADNRDIKRYDITLAFTDAPYFCDGWQDDYMPLALAVIMYRRKLILLSNPEKTKIWRNFYKWKYYKNVDRSSLKFLLIHELGHLFEARDVKDKKSFMFERMLTSRTRHFDDANKQIILNNKWKNFKSATQLK